MVPYIDKNIVEAARSNATRAGVIDMLHLQCRDVASLSHPKKYGFIITNPPYGERLEEKENLPAIYKALGERYANLDSWSLYLITSYDDACKYIGREPDKNRKIYNGMLQTRFYQYHSLEYQHRCRYQPFHGLPHKYYPKLPLK